MCRRIAGIVLTLVFLVAAGVGFIAFRMLSPTAQTGPSAPVTAAPSPAEQQRAEQTVDRLRRDAERLDGGRGATGSRADSGHPRSAPVEFRVTQKEVNDLLIGLPEVRKTLSQQKIAAPELTFQPDRIVASARVPVYHGVQASVSAVGKVWAEDGHLAYRTEGVYLGDLPAPRRVRRELDRALRGSIQELNRKLGARIETVQVTDGELVVRVRG